MSRILSSNLEEIMLRATTRSPEFRLEIYDLRSTSDTMRDVVLFNVNGQQTSLRALTGPRDFTPEVESVTVQERRGDYVNGGPSATSIQVTLADGTGGILDPLRILGLSPASEAYRLEEGRFFRKDNAVVLRVGDSRVDESEWPVIFTGAIAGQAGRQRSRSDGAESRTIIVAHSREARFSQFERTAGPYSIGTTFLGVARNIAQDEMGLDLQEVDLSGWGSDQLAHDPVSLVDISPLSMLAQLMFADGFLPKFDGFGRLSQISSVVTGAPDRVYQDLRTIRKIDRPFSDVEQPNCVTVTGLESNLTKVVQPFQSLATADITTGFFTSGEEFEVYWIDDQSIVAEAVQTIIHKSINEGISILGGDEEFDFIPIAGTGGGYIGVTVTMDTGFAPWIVVFLLVLYIILAIIPDIVVFSATISVGRLIQAIALSAAVYIMTKIGRGQYEWMGSPIEWVYRELKCRACVDGRTQFDRNTVDIENHLISRTAQCRNAARQTLLLLQAQENPRMIQMFHDLLLEPDDIFEIPTGQRYLIDSLNYTLRRGDPAIAQAACFEVTDGVIA